MAASRPHHSRSPCCPRLPLAAAHPIATRHFCSLPSPPLPSCGVLTLSQAQHLESYFAQWRSLEGLVHALAREDVLQGPLTEAACALAEGWRCEAVPNVSTRVTDLLPDEPLTEELVAEIVERHEAKVNVTYDFGEAALNVSYFDLQPRVPSMQLRRRRADATAERDASLRYV